MRSSRTNGFILLLSGLSILSVSLLMSGCPMSVTSHTSGGEATPLVNKSVILKDANGAVLGYVTETDTDSITVLTSKEYFVSLDWNGTLKDGACWYTGVNGSGTLFYIAPIAERLFGFAISIKGEAYVAENLNASGYAVPNDSVVSFQSYYSGGVITNATGRVPTGYVAYSLKAVSLGDLGLPSSTAAPRELVFQ